MSVTLFSVDRVPVKRRPRFSHGVAYVDAKTKADEKAVRDAYHGIKHEGAVSVEIHVYGKLPKSRPKRIESEPNTVKPDADNIAKAVLDGLNGVAFEDDSQVTELTVIKHDRRRDSANYILCCIKPAASKEGEK